MLHSRCDKFLQKRVALSLLELIIVLVILAALTGIAVQSIQPIADQARFEATQRTLGNVDLALLNRTFRDDGTIDYVGFVADVGRLPIAREDSSGSGELVPEELWRLEDYDADMLTDLATFSIGPIDDPNTTVDESSDALESDGSTANGIVERIVVAAGWRGPYVERPLGTQILRDGYGQALTMYSSLTPLTEATSGQPIVELASLGTDQAVGNAGGTYDQDILLPSGPLVFPRIEGAVAYRVRMEIGGSEQNPELSSANERLLLQIYGPSGTRSTPGLIDSIELLNGATDGTNEIEVRGVTANNYTCGTRMIRAIVVEDDGTNLIVRKSSGVKQITIPPGGTSEIQFELPE